MCRFVRVGGLLLMAVCWGLCSCEDASVNNPLLPPVDNGSGVAPPPALGEVLGCMDPNASSYQAPASVDDGSCTYRSLEKPSRAEVLTNAVQNFFVEDITGAWCGWCPGAVLAIDHLERMVVERLSSPKVVRMEVHTRDRASTPSSTERHRTEHAEAAPPHIVLNLSRRIATVNNGFEWVDEAIRTYNSEAEANIHLQVQEAREADVPEATILFSFAVPTPSSAPKQTYYYSIMLLVDVREFDIQLNYYSKDERYKNGHYNELYEADKVIRGEDYFDVFVGYIVKEAQVTFASQAAERATFTREHTYKFPNFGDLGNVAFLPFGDRSIVVILYKKQDGKKIFLNTEEIELPPLTPRRS